MIKKIFILSFLLCLSFLPACTKRDKLTNNTMFLSIVPSVDITLSIGGSYDLSAIVRNIRMEEVDEPVNWSVENDLGTFSSQSKNTTFMAANTGVGKIILTCQGVQASVNVTVS